MEIIVAVGTIQGNMVVMFIKIYKVETFFVYYTRKIIRKKLMSQIMSKMISKAKNLNTYFMEAKLLTSMCVPEISSMNYMSQFSHKALKTQK